MGQCYGQLSLEERVEIYRLHAGGRSQNEIASALERAPSTISRELRRNSRPTKVWMGGYEPVRAQQLAERRRRHCERSEAIHSFFLVASWIASLSLSSGAHSRD